MFIRKSTKRTLNNKGKEVYDFNYESEKDIYKYVCYMHVGKIKLRELEKKKCKFDTYMSWEQYVRNKCSKFPLEKLNEFSRYLNQRKRNLKTNIECWKIVAAVLLTFLVTDIVSKCIVELTTLLADTSSEIIKLLKVINISSLLIGDYVVLIVTMVVLLMIFGVSIVGVIYAVRDVISPIWENDTEENLLADYKEIVDKMIIERLADEMKSS